MAFDFFSSMPYFGGAGEGLAVVRNGPLLCFTLAGRLCAGSAGALSSGALAGLTAVLLTYPNDTIRRRMQVRVRAADSEIVVEECLICHLECVSPCLLLSCKEWITGPKSIGIPCIATN